MKLLFQQNNHKIVVSRGFSTAELVIDDSVEDVINGFGNTQMKSFSLKGYAKNIDGSKEEVLIQVEVSFPMDTVSFFYAGNLIEKRKVSN